ncbi:MAG: peroxiredoxin [Bacteriovorax sp.]|nr:peroxiredoxin [Bacteriovorax sp.]
MKKSLLLLLGFLFSLSIFAADLAVDSAAPIFKLQTHKGTEFNLESRRGKWSVLYFYPKAETPGCTKQACAFRDSIKKIRALDADVFGISSDNVADQAAFHKNHNLNFILLADDKSEVAKLYGSKMLVLSMSKRWTFIIDPDLKIRSIDKDVDPVVDAEKVAAKIAELKAKK